MSDQVDTFTVLVAPPQVPDLAGQRMLVARLGAWDPASAAVSYAKKYWLWRRIGAMDSRGQLVWLDPFGDLESQFKARTQVNPGDTFIVRIPW